MSVLRMYVVCRVSEDLFRQFWIKRGGLIVSYPRYIIEDRMFNRPGSYRLWVSVIRVVSSVNVATVSAHLHTNSCLEGGEDEKKTHVRLI